jgi:hypothetical protein
LLGISGLDFLVGMDGGRDSFDEDRESWVLLLLGDAGNGRKPSVLSSSKDITIEDLLRRSALFMSGPESLAK